MTGKEIKAIAKEAGVTLWRIANSFGCTDATFSRKLRYDFSPEDTSKILNIINELKAKKA